MTDTTTTINRNARKISAQSKKHESKHHHSKDHEDSDQVDIMIDLDTSSIPLSSTSSPNPILDNIIPVVPICYGRCCPKWDPPCFSRLCVPSQKNKGKKTSITMRPSISPDLRRWNSLPERTMSDEKENYWEQKSIKRCCVRFLQEVDQPREISSIPAYNPNEIQDDIAGRFVYGFGSYIVGGIMVSSIGNLPLYRVLFYVCMFGLFIRCALRGICNSKKEQEEKNNTNIRKKKTSRTCIVTRCTHFLCGYCISCCTRPKTTRSCFAPHTHSIFGKGFCHKLVPCLQKIPTASNSHLGRDRCPSLTYLLLAWQFIIVIINIQFQGTETSLCKLHYHVDPNTAILGVINENTENTEYENQAQGISTAMGAQLVGYQTYQPKALFNASLMMSDATFVFAENIMKIEHDSHKKWYKMEDIYRHHYTWPTTSPDKSYYVALNTLFFFLVLSGSNAYSNRWFGWASLLWIFAVVISFGQLKLQMEDLKYCSYECLNDDGYPFEIEKNIPEFVNVTVYQNGTCDNSYQLHYNCHGATMGRKNPICKNQSYSWSDYYSLQHAIDYQQRIIETTSDATNLGRNNGLRDEMPQPYAGCATWRTTVTVPTANLQVIDYESNKPVSGIWSSMTNVLGETFNLEAQVQKLVSCMNTSVVPEVNDIAVNCALQSSGPFIEKFQTCVLQSRVGDVTNAMNPKDLNKLIGSGGCLEESLLGNMGIITDSSSTNGINVMKDQVKNKVTQHLTKCLDRDASICLITKQSPEECAKKCASKIDLHSNKIFDKKYLMKCASKQLPKDVFEQYEDSFIQCSSVSDNLEPVAGASKKTIDCAVGSLTTKAKDCFQENTFNLDSTIFNAIYDSLSQSPLTTTTTNKLQPLVNMARQQSTFHKKIPFRKAVERQLNSCKSYLAGNGTVFSHSQNVILESYTMFLFALSMSVMLIFILIDALWMVLTRSVGLRTRLCNKLSNYSTTMSCGLSYFFLCDHCSFIILRCLYRLHCTSIKPNQDEEEDDVDDDSDDGDNCDDTDIDNDIDSKDKEKNATRIRSPTIEKLKKVDKKDTSSSSSGKRCCRAMPPVFIGSILATTVVLVWNFQMLFAFSLSWKRWGMVLANAVLALPNTIKVLNDRISTGNITTSNDYYAYYGNPVPSNVPVPVRELINSIVQWFVMSGTVQTTKETLVHNDLDDKTIWQYVFVAIYYILVYTICCTFFAMTVSAIAFVFRTRSLWKKIAGISRAQKKLIRRYFDPNENSSGWQELPVDLKNVLKTAGVNSPISSNFKYQNIQGAAPFPALFFWMNLAR